MGWSRQGSGAKLGRTKHQLKRKKEGFKQSNSQRCDVRFPKARTRFPNGQCSPPAGVPARRVLRFGRHDKNLESRESRVRRQTKFFGCDVSRPNPIDKMIKQRRRQILPANLRHAIARRRSHGRCSLEQPRLQSRLSRSRAARPTWTAQAR